jgi:tetratricopeptide (TPR) repeat protein
MEEGVEYLIDQNLRRIARFVIALLLIATLHDRVHAQTAPSPAGSILRRAFELSREACTEAEFTQVLALCDQAAAQGNDLPSAARYERKLRIWALEARASAFMDAGQFEPALDDLDAALKLDPKSASALRSRGKCLARLGRQDEAFVDLDRAIELSRGDAEPFAQRGEINYAVGRFREALHDYEQALWIKSDHAGAMVGRGHAKYRLGQIAAAVTDYTRAIKLRPRDATLYTQRGNAYADSGRYTEAAADFRRAMKLDPNYGRAFQSAAWLMSTCPDPRYRNEALAIELSKRAIELDGKSNHRYLETLAAALANAGYYDEARQVQERALQRTPEGSLASAEMKLETFAAGKPFRDAKSRR